MKPATTAFKWARFKRLLCAQWAEQQRGYGRFWLVVAAVHALLMFILLITSSGWVGKTHAQASVFWMGLFTSGVIFAGLYFSALRRPESALLLLMRPATALEKWLLAAFFTLLVWPLAYTASATLINALSSTLGYQFSVATSKPDALPKAEDFALFIPLLQNSKELLFSHIAWLTIYGSLMGYVLFGSVYFKKHAGIKTGILAFVIFLLTIFVNAFISTGMRLHPEILAWWRLENAANHFMLLIWLANLLFWCVVPALLWLCALLALREKDLT